MRDPFRWLAAWLSKIIPSDPVGCAAVRLAFELPTTIRKGLPMANFELPNDEVSTITIKATNAGGVTEPIPAGDAFTATSSNPASLGAVIGLDSAGNPALVLTPLVAASPGLVVTVADSAGLAKAILIVDIVPDVTPANLILDVADATHVSQLIPAAPGP